MKSYIYIHKNSLSNELCKDIIEKFEANTDLAYKGVTSEGINLKIKDTLDLNILNLDQWDKINKFLKNEIYKHLFIYHNLYDKRFKHYQVDTFQIQRYEKNVGKFIRHTDELNTRERSREIVFMWYLNDVDNGGETCFPHHDITINPEAGKLVFFPSTWTYPHCGNVPLSSNKYIITGWINIIYTDTE